MDKEGNISKIEQYIIDYVFKFRKERKLNQADIATIIGVNRVFITNVENPSNRAKYNIDHINLLADHFGMSPKDFLPEKAML
jgi:transcriptional regulator with XRE-family HTH domain